MRIITAIIAIIVGILVLLGYFLPQAAIFQVILLDWAIILAGAATLAGVLNLVTVHSEKIRTRSKDNIYSAILILGMFATFVFSLLLKPQNIYVQTFILNGIIVPIEASLMALLAVSLLYAAVRLLRHRADLMGIVFVLTAALLFFGSATLPFGDVPIMSTLVRPWVSQILALGGARGILIGVALGTLTTGLRVLFGIDRPYGGK